MKYYLIAGEASGDVHGANLIASLKKQDPQAQIRAWGGDLMQNQGAQLAMHYKHTAFMGIFEVVANLRKILANLRFCKQDILDFQPDAVILIDYPGFNFKIAKFAKQHGFKTLYYISPKIWAWKTGRVERIKADVDKVFAIFPFEPDFYAKHHYHQVEYVGNPILDNIQKFKERDPKTNSGVQTAKKLVPILCGSRVQEVKHLLPIILKSLQQKDKYQYVVAGLSSLPKELYDEYLAGSGVKLVMDKTYELLEEAHAAIVASGTASLETALFKVPHIVVYKMAGGWIIGKLGRIFIKTPFASLVNIINGRESVKELLQIDFTVKTLRKELTLLLEDKAYRSNIASDYQDLAAKMGTPGASDKTAQLILKELGR